jgi:WD40 repeat protein
MDNSFAVARAACLLHLPPLSLLPRSALISRRKLEKEEAKVDAWVSHDVESVTELWVVFSDWTVRVFSVPNIRLKATIEIPPPSRLSSSLPLGTVGVCFYRHGKSQMNHTVVILSATLGFVLINGLNWTYIGDVEASDPDNCVTSFTHLPQRQQIWTGDSDGVTQIWTYEADGFSKGKRIQISHEIVCMTSTADSVLVSGGEYVTVIDIRSDAIVKYFWIAHPHGSIVALQSLWEDGRVISVDRNREMKIWDASTYDLLDQFELSEKTGEVNSCAVYPEKTATGIVVSYANGQIVTYEPTGRSRVQTFPTQLKASGPQIVVADVANDPSESMDCHFSGLLYFINGKSCEVWGGDSSS